MAFRKRNAPLNSALDRNPGITQARPDSAGISSISTGQVSETTKSVPGVRPSPVDGRPTVSTGTASLDDLLAGHAGLPLGNSLFIEESGTTDYAGSLLRFYAAEGIAQGHKVHVVGVGEHWGRELPGIVQDTDMKDETHKTPQVDKDKMKIAWRYERQGDHGAGSASRGQARSREAADGVVETFCHKFDLTKRLTLPSPEAIKYFPILRSTRTNPFDSTIDGLSSELNNSDPQTIHRLVVPSLLSPAIYPDGSCLPSLTLQFLHRLRGLLRSYPTQLTAIISFPLALFPRTTGLTCWMELLADGVIELVPLPHTVDAGPPLSTDLKIEQEEKPQGMVRIHRLPVFHDRGGGTVGKAGVGDDLAFTLSRRRFVIKPYSLPPVEGDQEAQHGDSQGAKAKIDIDF